MAYNNFILTDNYNKTISSLFMGNSDKLYMVIGSGNESWDTDGLPTSYPTNEKVVNEVARLHIDTNNIAYVNPDDIETVSDEPTNTIRINIDVESSLLNNQYIREYGLYGINANDTSESGIMFEYCNFTKLLIPADTIWKKSFYLKIQ